MHGDISVSLSSRRELGGNHPPPPSPSSHKRARARASASRSFSPFFPRSRSQILTYDYVGGVSARISPESRGGRRNGFADPRGHGSGNSGGDPRSREGGRESRADKREIEVRGGGGRRNPEGNEEDVQEDAVVAED